jgi:histidinol-phosphate phosphatase family protein
MGETPMNGADRPDSVAGRPPAYSVVVPTIGRRSLDLLLRAISSSEGPAPAEVIVVDDRKSPEHPLVIGSDLGAEVVRGPGRGPAAARNLGWRRTTTPWVVFVDDDVVPGRTWRAELVADLENLPWQVVGSQARVRVPGPASGPPTDWERNVAGLETAQWATAELAYRRSALEEVGGFDERFPRAFREDADLGLRMVEAGYVIVRGERSVDHPVRDADRWISVRLQAGNADDVLLRARHGSGWRSAAGAEPGRNGRHLVTVGAAAGAAASALLGRRRRAKVFAAAWLAGTVEFAVRRIAPGPRTRPEVTTMILTSVAIPFAAVAHLIAGLVRLPVLLGDRDRAPLAQPRSPLALKPPPSIPRRARRPRAAKVDVGWSPAAILFDRDGTLVVDVPGNTDSARIALMPGARTAVRRARSAGLKVGVVTNQAAIGRGSVTGDEVATVNRRVDDLIGPFDTWQVCPHVPEDRCGCRKPGPGLVTAAAASLGVPAASCAVIGDIGSDLGAAKAAGARSVLVPTPVTKAAEIASAPVVASDLLGAVDLVLAGMC